MKDIAVVVDRLGNGTSNNSGSDTCRNIFSQPFNIFRPIYNDYRDDHVVFRQLSRSAGIVIKQADHITIYLTPALHRQPRQWEQIRRLKEICTHRIRHTLAVNIHFLTGRSKREIFAAIRYASVLPATESQSDPKSGKVICEF